MIYNQIGWVHVSKIISAVYASEALNKDLETGLEVRFQLNSATQPQEKSVRLTECAHLHRCHPGASGEGKEWQEGLLLRPKLDLW